MDIQDSADPRLTPYRDLKGRETPGVCVAEGPLIVERLLASSLVIESVLIGSKHAERFAGLGAQVVAAGGEQLVASEELMESVLGFHFHRGILAVAKRPEPRSLRAGLPELGGTDVIVVCPEINSPENLGSIFRVSDGFGARAVVLGSRCSDPLSRRCLRVSMGSALHVPTLHAADLGEDLAWLRSRGVETLAAVLDADAESLNRVQPRGPVAVVLGAEADGLPRPMVADCARRVRIPMRGAHVDSLNVAIAASVFLYHLTAVE